MEPNYASSMSKKKLNKVISAPKLSYTAEDEQLMRAILEKLRVKYANCTLCGGTGHPTSTCGTLFMANNAMKAIPGVCNAWASFKLRNKHVYERVEPMLAIPINQEEQNNINNA